MATSILIIGAGELGLAMLEAISTRSRDQGLQISVLLRDSTISSQEDNARTKVQRIKDLGASMEPANVVADSVASLAAIFSRYDTVVNCMGMELPAGSQKKMLEAALQSGVRRYFPWQYGMDYDIIGQGSSQDLFDEQLEVRKRLRAQQAMDWVIVSTGLFMSFLFVPEFGVVELDKRTVRALGSWDNQITLTTPEDIARVTADVVHDPRGISRQIVYTAGDTLSYRQIADLLDGHFPDTPFKRELWDLEALRKQMEEDPSTMVKYRDTFAQGVGVAWHKDKTLNAERGIKMTTVKEYLESLY